MWGRCPFLLVLVHTNSVCALQESVSPALCKFWWFCGGANGDLLQEGLCHTQVCCTQSPCPCGSPLLTRTSAGDTQTQFWLSLCGLGVHFVPFPGLSSSGDQVLGMCTIPGELCVLITSPGPGHLVESTVSGFAICFLWRVDLRLQSSWRMLTIRDLRKTWLAAGSLLTVWLKMPSLGVRLQWSLALQLWLWQACLSASRRGGASPQQPSSPLVFTQSFFL